MLPDFVLPIEPLAVGPRMLVARDVPACVFFYGMPEALPDDDMLESVNDADRWSVRLAMERWLDELLARVVIAPRLSVEHVRRLGDFRARPALAYLRAVGWITEGGPDPAATAWTGALAPASSSSWPLEAWIAQPPAMPRVAMRAIAQQAHQVWSMSWTQPISEWIFNMRQALERDPLEAAAEGGRHVR